MEATMHRQTFLAMVTAVLVLALPLAARQSGSNTMKAGAKVFIAPMEDGFDGYLKTAIQKKQVPVTVVDDKSQAEFEITGHSETHTASTAKKLLLGKIHSDEQASIQVANLESGEVVFAYSVNKGNSAHGKQSSAEACAKNLKEEIEKKKK
jgi:hypothetical protein